MIKPLFAKGKELERTLSQAEGAGVTDLHVPTPGDFSPGDPIFIAEVDDSELEFLGPVQSVGSTTITVVHALATAKADTATVWRAASAFQWQTVSSSPLHRVFREGIAVERSVGGSLWSVRTADAVREDTVHLAGVSRSHFAAFRTWLSAQVRAGLDDFTWADEERTVARVRLLSCDLAQTEKTPRTVAVDLNLAVVEEGGYV